VNKQAKANGGRGIEWCDYTWNPIRGCMHACQWMMPDGTIANCYAEDVAGRVASKAYPHGFEHHYWTPTLLGAPARVAEPSKIFVGSMADVFGHWVTDEQIEQVLDVARSYAPWHTYIFLTKNPQRLRQFTFTSNCWVGVSTPPNFFWNRGLTPHQRRRLLQTSLGVLSDLKARGATTWISAEPLSIDIVPDINDAWMGDPYQCPPVDWIVIGAASNGRAQYAPDEAPVRGLVDYCDETGIRVFFKGNLRSLPWAAENWREEFPMAEVHRA